MNRHEARGNSHSTTGKMPPFFPREFLRNEPTHGLDEEKEEKITDILKGLGLSYICVSHHLDFLFETADKIYAMADGKIPLDEA